MDQVTVALDAMGGDFGPDVVIPAAHSALQQFADLRLIIVGDQATLLEKLKQHNVQQSERLSIRHASQVVASDELPSHALRTKKDSSMRVAINLVKEGCANACVSAGNTGALMATARFVLKTLPGIDRPAILSLLPTTNGQVRVLDLGANVDCKAEHLFQFAVMGSVVAEAVDNLDKPRVALLNIGEEEIKGNEQVKKTAQLLSAAEIINYTGYIEGTELYKGIADVVVCDGFVGNVALKVSEGAAHLISDRIKKIFGKNIFTRLTGLIALGVLKKIHSSLDPARYNGASFIGLRGVVVKSHGSTSVVGFTNAIKEAMLEVEKNVTQTIHDRVAVLMQATETAEND